MLRADRCVSATVTVYGGRGTVLTVCGRVVWCAADRCVSAAVIAACWAALLYYGRQGYVDSTRRIIQTARYIERE